MSTVIRFNHVAPHFLVENVKAAVKFYKNVLGFAVDYLDGDPPTYAVVFRDEVYIHLTLKGSMGFPKEAGSAFISVSEVKALWSHATAEGIKVVEPLKEKDFGHGVCFLAFTIRDLDNNVLRIGEPLTASERDKKNTSRK